MKVISYRTERGPGSPAGQPRWVVGAPDVGVYFNVDCRHSGHLLLKLLFGSGATALGSVR
jgi:hypothetical protein